MTHPAFWIDLGFLLAGLVFGTLLTIIVSRLPAGQSIVTPASRCPACGTRLSLAEMVPVVSYLLQRGHCRHCKAAIPRRYLAIELATGLGFGVLSAARFGAADFWTLLVLWLLAISATAIDMEQRIIPNRLLLAGGLLLLPTLLPGGGTAYVAAGEGAVLLFLISLLIAIVGRGGFGLGDVKYLAVVGLALGPLNGLLALFLSIVLGGVYATFLLVSRRAGRRDTIAFGPFIALASVVAPLIATGALNYYRGTP